MRWMQLVKAAIVIAIIVAFFWFIWTTKSVLVPFGFAALLAYLLDPLVRKLEQKNIPRSIGGGIVVVSTILIMAFIVLIPWPIISQQTTLLQERLPTMFKGLQSFMNSSPTLQKISPEGGSLSSWLDQANTYITDNVNFSKVSEQAWVYFKQGGSILLNVVSWLVLLPIVTYFFLGNWPSTVKQLKRLVPVSWRSDIFVVSREMDSILSQFLRGQLLVMLCLALYYSIALKLTGLDVAISVGVLTGLFVIVPFVGFSIGLILGTISAFLQFGFTWPFFAVLAVYGVGQMIESYVLTPRLVGERIGLSPVAVLFSLSVFGALFGFVGMLFALPGAAMVAVITRHLRKKYFQSSFYLTR